MCIDPIDPRQQCTTLGRFLNAFIRKQADLPVGNQILDPTFWLRIAAYRTGVGGAVRAVRARDHHRDDGDDGAAANEGLGRATSSLRVL